VKAAESSVKQRRLETLATGGSTLIGMLGGRKRSITSTLSKNRMASAAKDKLEAEQTILQQYMEQLKALQQAKEEVEKEVREKWEGIADEISEITIKTQQEQHFLRYSSLPSGCPIIWWSWMEKDGATCFQAISTKFYKQPRR